MPRTLPWAISRKPSTDHLTALPSPRPSKRRRTLLETDSDSDTPVVPLHRQHEFNKHYPGVTGVWPRDRSPSTSPPPTPPDLEFMRAQDDEWIMVEDEFMSTAQQFTKHLHHAAYQQRKAELAQRSLVARSTAPRDAHQAKTHVVEKLAAKHGQDVERQGSEEAEGGDDLIIGDRRLARLMFANGVGGKGKARLDGLVQTTTSLEHAHIRKAKAKRERRGQSDTEKLHEADVDESVDENLSRPAHKASEARSLHVDDLSIQSNHSPSTRRPPSYGLGSSIFGQIEAKTTAVPVETQRHGSPMQIHSPHNLDEDGLPMRRQAPSLAELRQRRTTGMVKTESYESPFPPRNDLPDAPYEKGKSRALPTHVSSTARGQAAQQIKKAKDGPPDVQDVVPLFLD